MCVGWLGWPGRFPTTQPSATCRTSSWTRLSRNQVPAAPCWKLCGGRYQHVRQFVLITDNEPGQRAFYESLGFTEGSDFRPDPVRVFVQFR